MRFALISLVASLSALAQEPKDLQLFLLVGQSNMAGRGVITDADRQPLPGIWVQAQDLTWKPAIDPLHYDRPEIVGVGIGRSFAQAIQAAHPGASIGLIPAAFGGSSLDEWQPGTKNYTEAVRRTKAALHDGRLAGILWHQGEGDSAKESLAKTYVDRFQVFITQLRADLDAPDVPVVVGEIGRFYRNRPKDPAKFTEPLVAQLKMIPAHVPYSAFVSSEGLTDKGDSTHFDTPSLYILGRRYAAAFLKLESK